MRWNTVSRIIQTFEKAISTTNKLDTDTVDAINGIKSQENLVQKIAIVRKKYCADLAQTAGKPNANIKFLNGWLNRVDDCLNM